jgi:hypothetical protein
LWRGVRGRAGVKKRGEEEEERGERRECRAGVRGEEKDKGGEGNRVEKVEPLPALGPPASPG